MELGTRVRIRSDLDLQDGDTLGAMAGATGTVIEDPIAEERASFWAVGKLIGAVQPDEEMPNATTLRLDDPTRDPQHEEVARVAPEQIGVIYVSDNEVEVIENEENTVNA